jgi:hypothetical protein
MLRSFISGVALAGVLAAAHPSFAEPLAAPASDQAQATAPATEQPAPPALAQPSSSDATPRASAWPPHKDIVPVGFGWG